MKMYIRDEIALTHFPKAEDRTVFQNVHNAFTNRGIMIDEKGIATKFELKDLITSQDLTRFIPQTVETIVREALEPNLFITDRLFQTIQMERGSRVQIGAIGAMEIGRVGQGGEYPEAFVNVTDVGDMVAITTDKYGVKLSITQEVIDENLYDVVGIWLRAAGRAFARHKERQAAKLINEMGFDVYNNIMPPNAYIGGTTGRDVTGAFNGSMTVNDMFEMYAYLLHRGFSPDAVLMHPLAWKTFMCDTEMREVVLANATVASYKNPNGSYASAWATGHNGLGLRTTATGNTSTTGSTIKGASAWTQTLNPLGATFNIAPRYLPTPLEVIVTQYVPFKLGTRVAYNGVTGTANETTAGALSNIIMVDSSNCGLIAESKPLSMDRWVTPERDITNIKMGTSYGLNVVEQGKAIAIARNISTDRNYNFENSNAVTLTDINRDSGYIGYGTSL